MRLGATTEVDVSRRCALQNALASYSLVDRRLKRPSVLACRGKIHSTTRCSSSSSVSPGGENGPAADTPGAANARSSRVSTSDDSTSDDLSSFAAKDARVHLTSVKTVHPDAVLGEGVEVGPFCVIGPSVVIGANTRLLGHNCIAGKVTIGRDCTLLQGALIGSEEDAGVVTIGDGNRFGHYCSIGVRCADLKYRENDPGHVTIGDNNDIREYVGIHCSSSGDHVTEIGDQNLLMGTVHIGHDAKLGHQNILANGSLLAGHVVLGNRVVVGGASGIAQRCWVGSYSMVGAGSMVVMDVPPYVRVQGDRAKIRGLNKVQFVRSDFSVGEKSALSRLYRDLWLKNSESVKGMGERLDELIQAKKYDDFEHCQHLIEFIYESANTESSMRCNAMCTTLK